MPTVVNTLYPPLVETYMPAFLDTAKEAVISFSLSPYNTPETITKIHVSLVDKATNQSVLKGKVSYSSKNGWCVYQSILIIDVSNSKLKYDTQTGLYSISISINALKNETSSNGRSTLAKFKIDNWYQAQLRLDNSSTAMSKINGQYLLSQREHFSEWSRITLLRAIPQPLFYFAAWDKTIDNTVTAEGSNPIKQKSSDGTETRLAYLQEGIQVYNKGFVPIAASIIWQSKEKTQFPTVEYLDHYTLKIFAEGSTEDFINTGPIYIGDQYFQLSDETQIRDSLYYLADMNNAEVDTTYIVRIEAVTRNGYEWWDERSFTIAKYTLDPNFEVDWKFDTVILNSYGEDFEKIVTEEDGFVRGRVISKNSMPPGYLYIYRSSSVDNYNKNDIIQVTYENGDIDTFFEDRTVSSLIQYCYKAQYHIKNSGWSPVRRASLFVYPDFYDILLLRQDKQLAIRYDGKISNLKPVVNRTKIDTLGSKYPRFAENARMNYYQFSITGFITAESDFNRKFLDETDDEFAPTLLAYDENIGNEYLVRNDTILSSFDNPALQGSHDTYLHNNWYWERTFREKATAWLNDGEPKLFRSMTEGNMIVMLTDVSLSPNETLGRRLYTFSATAYEIGDGNSLEDLHKFGIFTVKNEEEEGVGEGESDEHLIEVERIGQYVVEENDPFSSISDIVRYQFYKDNALPVKPISMYDTLLQYYTGVRKGREPIQSSLVLKDLKIQFTSKPLWWTISSDSKDLSEFSEDSSELSEDLSKLWFGYKFNVILENDNPKTVIKTIFVNEKGYYQFPSDLTIQGLEFFKDETYELDYILDYKIEYKTDSLVSKVEKVRNIVGQDSGVYYPNFYLGDEIREKYRKVTYEGNHLASEQEMQYWNSISLDVTPYALFQLKWEDADEFETRLVGRTGVYTLEQDFNVDDLVFLGRRMVLSENDNRPFLDEWQYYLDSSVTEDEDSSAYWYDIIVSPTPIETDTLVSLNFNDAESYIPADYWRILQDNEDYNYAYMDIKDTKNPQYNTIYKLVDKNGQNPVYVIYYLDQGWYTFNFNNTEDYSVGLAQVPISGMINYRGSVIKKTYNVE